MTLIEHQYMSSEVDPDFGRPLNKSLRFLPDYPNKPHFAAYIPSPLHTFRRRPPHLLIQLSLRSFLSITIFLSGPYWLREYVGGGALI